MGSLICSTLAESLYITRSRAKLRGMAKQNTSRLPKGMTKTSGYYNGATWPIQVVLPKLNITLRLQPGEFIVDHHGRKINDPLFEAFANRGLLIREFSDAPVTVHSIAATLSGCL